MLLLSLEYSSPQAKCHLIIEPFLNRLIDHCLPGLASEPQKDVTEVVHFTLRQSSLDISHNKVNKVPAFYFEDEAPPPTT